MKREIFKVVSLLEKAREEMNYIATDDLRLILKIQDTKRLIEDAKSNLFDLNDFME